MIFDVIKPYMSLTYREVVHANWKSELRQILNTRYDLT